VRATYTHTSHRAGAGRRRPAVERLSVEGLLCSVSRMRIRGTACRSLLSLTLACTSNAPPPESAPSHEARAAEPSSSKAPSAADPKADGASAGEQATTDEDVNAILQLVVDDPELDRHLHLGTPGRFPLQISGERLPSKLELVKAGEPVKLVNPPTSKQDAVLVLTEIDVRGKEATVRYRYDIEGIRATVTLAKLAHGWELKNSRLVEH
jgi:hypothetical protein